MNRFLQYSAYILIIMVSALYLSVRYVVWPNAAVARPHIEAFISDKLGQPVSIQSIKTEWYGLTPVVHLRDLRIARQLAVKSASLEISWRSLWVAEPRFSRIQINGLDLQIERVLEKVIQVAGFELDLGRQDAESRALPLLLAQRRIELVGFNLTWKDTFASRPEVKISDVALAIENRGRSHRLKAELGAIGEQGSESSPLLRQAQWIGRFTRPIGSKATDIARWRGESYFQWSGLKPTAWVEMLSAAGGLFSQAFIPEKLQQTLKGGMFDGQLWADVQESAMLTTVLQASDLKLSISANPLELRKVQAQGVFTGPLLDEAGGLSFERLLADQISFFVADEKGVLFGTQQPIRLALQKVEREGLVTWQSEGRLNLQTLDVRRLLAYVDRIPLGKIDPKPLIARAPQGKVEDLSLEWNTSLPTTPWWSLTANLVEFSVKPGQARENRLGVPGFEGLNAQLKMSPAGGQVSLSSGNRSSLTVPGLFDEQTVDLDKLAGDVAWRFEKGQLQVQIEQLSFQNADLAGAVKGSYSTGGKSIGLIDLSGDITRAKLDRVYRYLPRGIAEPVRNWIRNSVTAGQVESSSFVLRGDLFEFPFRPDESASGAKFEIATRLRGVTLAYSPEWPEIRQLTGSLVFSGPGMSIDMQSGSIFDVAFKKVEAQITDFRRPDLIISGVGRGPASDMIRFVNTSPILSRIDNFTQATEADGDAELDLKLVLPLAEMARTKVNGVITLLGNRVLVDQGIPEFTEVLGHLNFSEKGFSLNQLNGLFLGAPIRVNSSSSEAGKISITAVGQMTEVGLRTLVNDPLTARLSGTVDYEAKIEVSGRSPTFEVRSNLVGLRSDLPAPFTKAAGDTAEMLIRVTPDLIKAGDTRPMTDRLLVTVGPEIALAFDRRRNPKSLAMQIVRGSFAVGADPVLPEAGFAVALITPYIDLDQWTPILSALRDRSDSQSQPKVDSSGRANNGPNTALGFAEGFSLLPSSVSIAASEVKSGTRVIKDLVMGATRLEGNWRANISAEQIGGFFTWRDAPAGQTMGVLTARFNRLQIPAAQTSEVVAFLDSAPQQLPGLDIAAEEFIIDKTVLGRASLIAKNQVKDGRAVWLIESLKIQSASASLSASGQWASHAAGRPRSTSLDFDLTIADSGALLNQLGVKDAVRAAPGSAKGRLDWDGSPLAIDYPSLSGELNLNLEKGQFLKVDPGAAKLIGVLNLQSLPKRLTFDFSDLVDQGFAFDRVTGKAQIERGVATTSDLEIRGAQARVRINGQADLFNESQDLVITVTPEINAGLASLAYTAINPAIGLGTLIAQAVLRKPIQDAFAYELEVKGSWVDPKVEQRKKFPVQLPQDSRTGEN